MGLEAAEPDRQQIMVSRPFADRVDDHEAGTFGMRACEKLRSRGLVAVGAWVFAQSDVFQPELRQHNASATMGLPASTADTTVALGVVRELLRGQLRGGVGHRRQAWRCPT
jgi:DNA polymerase V